MESRIAAELDTGRAGARKKTCALEVEGGASQSASEVVLGLAVAAREARTGEPEDGLDVISGYAAAEELLGDPEVGDAPIRLGKALRDVQAVQEPMIDSGRCGRCNRAGSRFGRRLGGGTSGTSGGVGRSPKAALGCLDESAAVGCQLGPGVKEPDPGSVTAPLAPGGFLIVSTEVTDFLSRMRGDGAALCGGVAY
jgi:hypothetical protein